MTFVICSWCSLLFIPTLLYSILVKLYDKSLPYSFTINACWNSKFYIILRWGRGGDGVTRNFCYRQTDTHTQGAISSDLYHTPKMGGILISWCHCVKNVSNKSIKGQWWRNDPCVSSFLLQIFFLDNFFNMWHTNFWQFFQISDFILHDKCLFKLF